MVRRIKIFFYYYLNLIENRKIFFSKGKKIRLIVGALPVQGKNKERSSERKQKGHLPRLACARCDTNSPWSSRLAICDRFCGDSPPAPLIWGVPHTPEIVWIYPRQIPIIIHAIIQFGNPIPKKVIFSYLSHSDFISFLILSYIHILHI